MKILLWSNPKLGAKGAGKFVSSCFALKGRPVPNSGEGERESGAHSPVLKLDHLSPTSGNQAQVLYMNVGRSPVSSPPIGDFCLGDKDPHIEN